MEERALSLAVIITGERSTVLLTVNMNNNKFLISCCTSGVVAHRFAANTDHIKLTSTITLT